MTQKEKERCIINLGVLPENDSSIDYKSYKARDVWKVIVNEFKPTNLIFYFKNGLPPFMCNCANEKSALLTATIINDALSGHFSLLNDDEITMFKQGPCEKEGKRVWSQRYAVIMGYKLLIFRNDFNKIKYEDQYPLNVIDLIDAQVSIQNNNILNIKTHRTYQFKFVDTATATSWFSLCSPASLRGIREYNRLLSFVAEMSKLTPDAPSGASSLPRISTTPSFKEKFVYIWGMKPGASEEESILSPTKVESLSTPFFDPVYISAGHSHVAVIDNRGDVYTFGDNSGNQLGYTTTRQPMDRPQCLISLRSSPIKYISCGGMNTYAISQQGRVYVWGTGEQGQNGLGDNCLVQKEPAEIDTLRNKNIISVSAGTYHTVFLDSYGLCYVTGNGYYGQLGLSNNVDKYIPVPLSLPFPVSKISAGGTFSLFQTASGYLYVCGYIGIQEEEFEKSKNIYNTPILFQFPGEKVVSIAAGYEYALVLTVPQSTGDYTDSKVYSWGTGICRGRGEEEQFTKIPIPIPSLSGKSITTISASLHHCFAFSSITNTLYAWGECSHGELGVQAAINCTIPTEVYLNKEESLALIACGSTFTFGLTCPKQTVNPPSISSPSTSVSPSASISSPTSTASHRPTSSFRPPTLSSKLNLIPSHMKKESSEIIPMATTSSLPSSIPSSITIQFTSPPVEESKAIETIHEEPITQEEVIIEKEPLTQKESSPMNISMSSEQSTVISSNTPVLLHQSFRLPQQCVTPSSTTLSTRSISENSDHSINTLSQHNSPPLSPLTNPISSLPVNPLFAEINARRMPSLRQTSISKESTINQSQDNSDSYTDGGSGSESENDNTEKPTSSLSHQLSLSSNIFAQESTQEISSISYKNTNSLEEFPYSRGSIPSSFARNPLADAIKQGAPLKQFNPLSNSSFINQDNNPMNTQTQLQSSEPYTNDDSSSGYSSYSSSASNSPIQSPYMNPIDHPSFNPLSTVSYSNNQNNSFGDDTNNIPVSINDMRTVNKINISLIDIPLVASAFANRANKNNQDNDSYPPIPPQRNLNNTFDDNDF
ncbi:hypothetical protein WA158_001046 [Blastocystis sp. Blastoise]